MANDSRLAPGAIYLVQTFLTAAHETSTGDDWPSMLGMSFGKNVYRLLEMKWLTSKQGKKQGNIYLPSSQSDPQQWWLCTAAYNRRNLVFASEQYCNTVICISVPWTHIQYADLLSSSSHGNHHINIGYWKYWCVLKRKKLKSNNYNENKNWAIYLCLAFEGSKFYTDR